MRGEGHAPRGHSVAVREAERVHAELFDISVEEAHHSYVGDGFVCHNCDPYRNVASIMANLMLQGRQPYVYGDGSQKRCFSYVGDVVPVLARLALDPDVRGEVFNVGPDEEFVSVLDVARAIARILDFPLDPVFVPGRPQEVHLATCSADKARARLGYATRYSLEDGLRAVVDYIRTRGPRPFTYHLDMEIVSERTPATWRDRLF